MKVIVQIARVLTGLLFIFSGVIKLNDPSGFSIKLNEYFDVFAQDVSVKQDTLKIAFSDGSKELSTASFALYSFDKDRELSISGMADTTQEVSTETKVRGKDTITISHVKVTQNLTVSAELKGQSAGEVDFDLPDSTSQAMFTLKATVAGKPVFQKDFKVSVASLPEAKTTLNLKDYVRPESWLNGFFKWMKDYTLWLSILICAVEVILGFALIVGWSIRLTAWLMLLLIVFFTFLTGYSWLSGFSPKPMFWYLLVVSLALILIAGMVRNAKWRTILLSFTAAYTAVVVLLCKYSTSIFPGGFDKLKMKVTDCGCFGDFMHLEPSESFYKDLILLLLILIVFFGTSYIKPWFSKKFGWKFMTGISLLSLGFGVFCYIYLPVWDFLPYKKGNNIKEIMYKVPEGMRATDSTQLIYVMHKDKDSITIPFVYPYTEYMKYKKEGWSTGRSITKMIIEGYHSPIHDFKITELKNQTDMTDSFLNANGYQLIWDMPYLDKGYQGANAEVKEIYQWAGKHKVRFWPLTSSGSSLIESWTAKEKPGFSWYVCDQKTLITIGRYNPTLYLFKGPVVVKKWSGRSLPSTSRLEKLTSQ